MRYKAILIIGLISGWTSAVRAEDNSLYITQDSLTGGRLGNTLSVDQSKADGSTVSGLNIDVLQLDPAASEGLIIAKTALQRGDGNSADVRVGGVGGQVGLMQDNSQSAGLRKNVAEVTALNGGSAMVSQLGGGNTATVNLDSAALTGGALTGGLASSGTVIQKGDGNTGTVNASNGGSGVLAQIGDGNSMTVNAINTNVIATQIGNNMIAAVPAQVTSSGATVQITQTQFPGVR